MMALSRVDSVSSTRKSEQPPHLIGIEGGRQPLLRLRRAHLLCRIQPAAALAQQKLVETSVWPTVAAGCCGAPDRRSAVRRRRREPESSRARPTRLIPRRSQNCQQARAGRADRPPPCACSCGARASDAPRSARSRRAGPRRPRPASISPDERVGDEFADSRQKLGAHRRMESVAHRSRRWPESPTRPWAPMGSAQPSRSRSNPCRTDNRAASRGFVRSGACRPASRTRRS